MDATNDVICGTCVNYKWSDVCNYALSLSRSGFRGRRVLFISGVNSATQSALSKLGFELIEFTPTMKHVVIERFRILHDWMETQKDIRYIIHCDVRDVVIQSDPSAWMEKQEAKLFGASEAIVYKDEACNPFWVELLFGKDVLESLNEEEVVCAGTIAGEAETVKRLSKRIFEMSTDRFGDDQAALNVLLRTEFKDVMRIPEPQENWILTAGWWLIGAIQGNKQREVGKRSQLIKHVPELRDGVAYLKGSDTPFCIVHQYERGFAWVPAINERYTGPKNRLDSNTILSKMKEILQPWKFNEFKMYLSAYKNTPNNPGHLKYLETQMERLAPGIVRWE